MKFRTVRTTSLARFLRPYTLSWPIALLLLAFGSHVFAQSADSVTVPTGLSPSTGILLPDRSITTQDDVASLEVNPAGLAFIKGGELGYAFSIPNDDFRGVLAQGQALFAAAGTGSFGGGFGIQWLHRPELGPKRADYRKYTLGLAAGSARTLSLGVNYNFFGSRDERQLNDLSTWDAGVQWRPSQHVGFGFFARDFSSSFLDNEQALPLRLSAGMALRFWEGRLVFDTELERVWDLNAYNLVPRVVIEPLDGLRLFVRNTVHVATSENPTEWTFSSISGGLELLQIQGGAHFSRLDGDNLKYAGQSYLFRISSDARRSLVHSTGRWLQFDIDNSLAEQATSSLLGSDRRSFMELLEDLQAVRDDATISGVVLRIESNSLGYAQIWELRQHIMAIQAAGKHTISTVSEPSTRSLYLASAAAEIWMPPSIPYFPMGLSAQFINYQQVLNKIGVEAEFVRIGAYKTAPEGYIKSAPSEQALEQTNAYLDEIQSELVDTMANRRGLKPTRVAQLFERVPIFGNEAVQEHLIDELVYVHEIESKLREKYRISSNLEYGYKRDENPETRWGKRPRIAVVYVDGVIVDGGSGQTPLTGDILTGSESMVETLERIRRDDSVRAVVLRIDSPGGSAMGSDIIFRKLRELAQTKPVIASMGNVAASGGYYVAAGADEIFAAPTTLTGSIGIFAGKFNVDHLTSAIGVNHSRIEKGTKTGVFNLLRPWTDAEREAISSSIHFMYRVFLNQVAQTRDLTAEQIDQVGRGHIWSGTAAQNKKLVDHLGGLMDAIARAEVLAGLKTGQADYVPYPGNRSILGGPFGAQAAQFVNSLVPGLQLLKTEDLRERSVAQRLLRDVETSVLLPMLFKPGEALMLPAQAISLD